MDVISYLCRSHSLFFFVKEAPGISWRRSVDLKAWKLRASADFELQENDLYLSFAKRYDYNLNVAIILFIK